MKKLWGMKNKIIYVYLFFLVISLITLFCFAFKVDNKRTTNYSDFSSGWFSDKEEISLSKVYKYENITKVLPEIEKDTQLYMVVKFVNIEVYLDNECIYKYDEYDKFFGKTPGVYFVRFDLFREYSGKEITIKIDNAYNDNVGAIESLYIGDSTDVYVSFMRQYLMGNLLSFTIIVVGLVLIVGFLLVLKYEKTRMRLLYLGLFAAVVGIFTLADSKILLLLFGNDYFFHVLSECFMLLLVVPLMQFIADVYYGACNKKILKALYLVGLANFVICFSLHILGMAELHSTLFVTHSVYIVCACYIIFICIKAIFSKNKEAIYHTIGILSICVGAFVDMAFLYASAMVDNSLFTRFGVLVFLCFEGVQFFVEYLRDYRRSQRIKLLDKLAYQDGLTELLNRTSFMEDMEKLKDTSKGMIAVIDVNNLKQVNDNFGHTAGDVLIIKIAEIMKKYLAPLGNCYRIGGDEFVFITTSDDLSESYKAIDKMNEYFVSYNKSGKREYKIEYAVGCAIVNKNNSFEEAFDKADKKMYDNKKKMKNK